MGEIGSQPMHTDQPPAPQARYGGTDAARLARGMRTPHDLRQRAVAVRRQCLRMVHRARLGHPGGDLSAADILVTLYFSILHVYPADPVWPGRDRFIMSKGHASGVFYATLAE